MLQYGKTYQQYLIIYNYFINCSTPPHLGYKNRPIFTKIFKFLLYFTSILLLK
nr:MAG TPA: hypothetical protein [Caudoviricetes sp.]